MNDKIWQWIGDYCSGLMDKSEEQELRAWMDEAEENKLFFMEGRHHEREGTGSRKRRQMDRHAGAHLELHWL